MYEVVLADTFFSMLRDFISERCQLLIFDKLELHLFISEELAHGRVIKQID